MRSCNAVTTHQLLSLRDAEPAEAYVAQHVSTCIACTREIARLRTLQAALETLPLMKAPTYSLLALRRVRQPALRFSVRNAGIVALAASVSAVALLVTFAARIDRPGESQGIELTSATPDSTMATAIFNSPTDLPMATLVRRSQDLESRLHRLPNRPHIERASTTTTIDSLQSKIQWVDYQLSLASNVGLNEKQATLLWEDRVQLMDSLVKVRYAEAQRFALLQ